MEANHRSEIEMINNKGANNNVNNINDPTVHNAQLLGKSQLSSLPLQMLIYLSFHYSPLFFFVNLCLFTFKGTFEIPTKHHHEITHFLKLCSCTILLSQPIFGLGTDYNFFIYFHRDDQTFHV